MGLTFSQTFNIQVTGDEEWFDPCLYFDSPLCIDPFLMLDLEQADEFKGAHDEIIQFFQRQFERVASAGGDIRSAGNQRVINTMVMPEAKELFLGYSEGTDGAGSGRGLATAMVGAIITSIAYGIVDIEHFEEISILGTGVGADRISDATARITRSRFARYTERICEELRVPTKKVILDRTVYDSDQDRWRSAEFTLPVCPWDGRPILLTPKRFLRHLPTLGSDEFNVYAERRWKEEHREALARGIVTFDKTKVLKAASENAAIRKQFLEIAQKRGAQPYDFDGDKLGVKMPDVAKDVIEHNPFDFKEPRTDKEMKQFVMSLVGYFKHFIEQQKGYELLWNDQQAKTEKAVQRLMFGLVFLICKANNVSIDPETNAGRGPVDFKFSKGFNSKCLLETKLARNTKWIAGVTKQLPTYVIADVGRFGVYMLVTYDGLITDKVLKLKEAAALVKANGIEVDVVVVDASPDKQSASKL